MSYKMFVSYSSKDKTIIGPILGVLQSFPDLFCFFFEQSNEPGMNTLDNILNELRTSNTVLLFNSINSLESTYVQNEVGVAIGQNKPVIVANLDNVRHDGMLNGVNYFDFYDRDKLAIEINRFREWIGKNITDYEIAEFWKWVFLAVVGVGAVCAMSKGQ